MSPRRGIPFRELRTRPDEFYGAIIISGRYHQGVATSDTNAGFDVGSVINQLWAFPYWVSRTMSVDRIAINVVTEQASSNVRVGIYDSGEDGLPANLLAESAEFDTSTSGDKTTTIALDLLGPRLYWTAAVTNVASVSIKGRNRNAGVSLGTTAPNVNSPSSAGLVAHTFGALPDPFGAFTVVIGSSPAVAAVNLRVA